MEKLGKAHAAATIGIALTIKFGGNKGCVVEFTNSRTQLIRVLLEQNQAKVVVVGRASLCRLTPFLIFRRAASALERYELGSAQDLPLQCNFWPLYARLVGALSF
ncbi:uncharacterized protein LOC129310623 [Prosopis cineraria]|uniref:uncharacterized protein LOC129310623 n=1 Tax=Prosopis cineraria TaxID=364024 RepID=UPI00241016C3|nr:uncharacterized protein LOC129310623 [Prosopis cineraria]